VRWILTDRSSRPVERGGENSDFVIEHHVRSKI
jgi:hypothetical protein